MRRKEWDGRRCPAACAIYGDFDSLFDTGTLRGGNGSEPFVFGMLTFLAAFRRVLKLLVPKKDLFARRPDEMRVAVDAKNGLIGKFGFHDV